MEDNVEKEISKEDLIKHKKKVFDVRFSNYIDYYVENF